jgi:flagellar motor switch protein FliM
MAQNRFKLSASISSDDPAAIKPVLEQLLGNEGSTTPTDDGFEVTAELEGESAKDLNRTILSGLRTAVKKTRMRAEWTSGNTVEKFFDYVLKTTRTID